MTPIEAYLILGLMFGGLAILIILTLWWMIRHNIMVNIDQSVDGVLLSKGFRARQSKERAYLKWFLFGELVYEPPKLYKMNDMFGTKPLDLEYDKIKDHFISTEAMPILGVKYSLNLYKNDDGELEPWHPPKELGLGGIVHNVRMVRINNLRTALWESTDNTTKAEVIARLLLPMAIIVLALACLIFFPKMYAAIQEDPNALVQAATESWSGWFDKVKPLG